MRDTAIRQYRAIVNRAAAISAKRHDALPSEGWIATVRKALGMSGAQLARRLGVTRARVSQAEHAELGGALTLRSMRGMAEAMGCRFVYAIVPDGRIEDVIEAQARRKARHLVHVASTHMALEDQSLSDAENMAEVERLTQELMRTMPSNLWADK